MMKANGLRGADYSITNLFPEDAMIYLWVEPVHQKIAADLGKYISLSSPTPILIYALAAERHNNRVEALQRSVTTCQWVPIDAGCACCFLWYSDVNLHQRTLQEVKLHDNAKYTKEQHDFIRYQWTDVLLSWETIARLFTSRFFEGQEARSSSDVESIFYRQRHKLPAIDNSDKIVFKANGHMETCSSETGLTTESLLDLFPEDAITYEWLEPRHRSQAATLGKYILLSLLLSDSKLPYSCEATKKSSGGTTMGSRERIMGLR
jgi:hypothetical protein